MKNYLTQNRSSNDMVIQILEHEYSELLPTAGAGCAVGGMFGAGGGKHNSSASSPQSIEVLRYRDFWDIQRQCSWPRSKCLYWCRANGSEGCVPTN
jgi:hypothetical protein